MVSVERALKIDGWMSKEELLWLAEQAEKSPFIIEVGSHLGRSTAALADNCPGMLIAVDLWNNDYIYMEFQSNRAENVLSSKGGSVERAMHLNLPGKANFIFIDADHSYEAVKADIAAWSKRLAPGGTIAGHDYDAHWPGVMRAVDEAYPGRLRGAGSIWYVRV
jgi:predicted O-methyltransferase YrrM